jgi:PEP-CTERM motif-containing protein
MPAWLSPRVRLGVMVSVIGLIVCALLLTPSRSDNDDDPPDALVQPSVSTAPVTATPLATYKPRAVALPQTVINTLRLRSSESSNVPLPGASGSVQLGSPEPETWSSLPGAPDLFGDFVIAERGIVLNWPGCADCDASRPRSILPWGGVGWPEAGGGITEDGPLPDLAPPIGVTELGNSSLEENGGDGDGPPRHPPTDPPPGDDDDPDPEEPPNVPVPEPSTVSLIAVAAFGAMVRARRVRKRKR